MVRCCRLNERQNRLTNVLGQLAHVDSQRGTDQQIRQRRDQRDAGTRRRVTPCWNWRRLLMHWASMAWSASTPSPAWMDFRSRETTTYSANGSSAPGRRCTQRWLVSGQQGVPTVPNLKKFIRLEMVLALIALLMWLWWKYQRDTIGWEMWP